MSKDRNMVRPRKDLFSRARDMREGMRVGERSRLVSNPARKVAHKLGLCNLRNALNSSTVREEKKKSYHDQPAHEG